MASISQPDRSASSLGDSPATAGAGAASVTQSTASPMAPWIQLVAGVICMAMIANLQYGWTIFVSPIDAKHHWGKAAIQGTFTLFILLETWLVPFEAYLADRFGPRPLVIVGGVMIGFSWMLFSWANTLTALYVGGMIGGVGTGLVYGTCIGNALKWFQARRGLAAGVTAAGFGAGAALTIVPLAHMVKSSGYEATFFRFGLLQGIIVILAALALKKPSGKAAARKKNPRLPQTHVDRTPLQTLTSGVFWLMYIDFVLVAASGLMATAQLAPIATGFGIANTPVTLVGVTATALVFALSLNNLMNGLSRPLFGWVSDWLGREMTMFLTFLAEGIGILYLDRLGSNPVWFVILAGLVFFAWGNIFSIFPALTSDHFGNKFATTNYALLYTAKGCAAFFVPIGSILAARTGSWHLTLVIASIANVVAALLMLFVLRPIRVRAIRREEALAAAAAD
ncbi:MAG TPA: oxalate/formate MFS antiporter [Candidatus Acidoferrum sp.]|jgi:OFA family oxalate/formate antiporter-like MFS transporter|nr:oxalate/formate MFS antiporter [Candidatus Acidoferrum sp.]